MIDVTVDRDPGQRDREPEPSEQPGRPTPSGIPNEARDGEREYPGAAIHECKRVRLRSGWCRGPD